MFRSIFVGLLAIGFGTWIFYKQSLSVTKRAWVTHITDDYLEAARVLALGLRRSGSKYPLVVMVTPDVSNYTRNVLQQEGCIIEEVDRINGGTDKVHAFARFNMGYTKLRAWTLTKYERLVWLDSDILLLQNIDELLDPQSVLVLEDGKTRIVLDDHKFVATQTCICNPSKFPQYPPWWNPQNCPHTYADSQSYHKIPSQFPHPSSSYFNAGVFILTPDLNEYNEIIHALRTWDTSSYVFAEQSLLNEFYKNKWQSIPYIYNALKTYKKAHSNIWDLTKIKVLHYILSKPWEPLAEVDRPHYESLHKLWQDVRDTLPPIA